jgi:hypothetical protein
MKPNAPNAKLALDAFQNFFLWSLLEADCTFDQLAEKHQLENITTVQTLRELQRKDLVIMQPYTAKEIAYCARGAKALDVTLKRLAAGKPAGKLIDRYRAYVPARYHITVKGIMHLIELEEAA